MVLHSREITDLSRTGATGWFKVHLDLVWTHQNYLGGGFKHFLFSPRFGEDFQFDSCNIFRWVETTNQLYRGIFLKHLPKNQRSPRSFADISSGQLPFWYGGSFHD